MTDAAIHDATLGEEVPASRAPQLALNEDLIEAIKEFERRERRFGRRTPVRANGAPAGTAQR